MWNHVEAWSTIAALVLFPVAIVAGVGYALHNQAREDGWGKTLTDTSALIGICVLLIGLALLGARFLT